MKKQDVLNSLENEGYERRNYKLNVIMTIATVASLIFGGGLFWVVKDSILSPANAEICFVSNGSYYTGDIQDYYKHYNTIPMISLNSDWFEIDTEEVVIKVNEWLFLNLNAGSYSSNQYTVPTNVEISLVNVLTGQEIRHKEVSIGQKIRFTDLPECRFYYVVRSPGFKTAISHNIFYSQEHDSTYDNIENTTIVYMEILEADYGKPFKVQWINSEGQPVANATSRVRVISPTEKEIDIAVLYNISSTEKGYMGFVSNFFYLSDMKFQVQKGYTMQVMNSQGIFVNVNDDSNASVYKIQY